jgi:N-carbamoyl-L-amino-acid hydrolase
MAAIEVMHTLKEHSVTTRHPLQMAIWTNEEGGFTGSGAAAGELHSDDLNRVYNGIPISNGVRKLGGDPTRLSEARLLSGAFRCYLELHIEQGGILYKANVPIGVVEGIVSIDEYEVEIRGFANHAGTTPMSERRNALLAAAKVVEAVQNVVTQEPGAQVGTVGKLQVFPDASNVVPGLVKHSIELRDVSAEKIARLGDEIRKRAQEISKDTGTEITAKKVEHDPPAVANPEIQANHRSCCGRAGTQDHAIAQWRWSRCSDDGEAWSDGNDLRPQRRGRQPFTKGTYSVVGLREWSQCTLTNDTAH